MRAADRLVAETVRRSGPWLAVLAVTSVLGAFAQLALPFVLGRTVDELVAGTTGTPGTTGGTGAAGLARRLRRRRDPDRGLRHPRRLGLGIERRAVLGLAQEPGRAKRARRRTGDHPPVPRGRPGHPDGPEHRGDRARPRVDRHRGRAGHPHRGRRRGPHPHRPPADRDAGRRARPHRPRPAGLPHREHLDSGRLPGGAERHRRPPGRRPRRGPYDRRGRHRRPGAGAGADRPAPAARATPWTCGGPTRGPACRRERWSRCWRWPCSGWAGCAWPPGTSPPESCTPPPATSCSARVSARRWATSAAWPGRGPPRSGCGSWSPRARGPTVRARCPPVPARWSFAASTRAACATSISSSPAGRRWPWSAARGRASPCSPRSPDGWWTRATARCSSTACRCPTSPARRCARPSGTPSSARRCSATPSAPPSPWVSTLPMPAAMAVAASVPGPVPPGPATTTATAGTTGRAGRARS